MSCSGWTLLDSVLSSSSVIWLKITNGEFKRLLSCSTSIFFAEEIITLIFSTGFWNTCKIYFASRRPCCQAADASHPGLPPRAEDPHQRAGGTVPVPAQQLRRARGGPERHLAAAHYQVRHGVLQHHRGHRQVHRDGRAVSAASSSTPPHGVLLVRRWRVTKSVKIKWRSTS